MYYDVVDPTSLTGADTLHPNDRKEAAFPQPDYSEAKKKHILFRRQRMVASRDTRDTTHDEFDGMGFIKWHDTMKKLDDQYVAPRKNKQDTSINMGTVRDKDTSLVEYAMKYDFEPVAQAYDDSDMILEEMAETGEDLVVKSKHMESYKDKARRIYRSMVSFGVANVEEAWVERWILEKTMKKGFKAGLGSSVAEWEEKLVKQYDGCQAKLWDLRKCYYGDIRKFFMNGPEGQPYFFTVEYESYDATKQIFGNWDMWKYVPTTVVYTPELQSPSVYSSSWTMRPITMYYCEIVRYYDPIANEFAITINGIDMLPIMETKITEKGADGATGIEKTLISGFPLTEISPSGAIPFAKYDLEPMHDFAYSKPQPAKMRVLADVENMFVKIMIWMMKQKARPTLGNKSGRMFGEEATDPGTVINDIRDGDLFPILPNFEGATTADFTMYKLVQDALSRNSIQDSFQGINPSAADVQGSETATANMNEMKAQTLKVAALFDGIISGENQLNWLRIHNIAKNWTKPIDQRIDTFKKSIEDVYRTITLPTEIEGGEKATKKIVFTKDTPVRPGGKPSLKDSMKLHQKEMDEGKANGGKEPRITELNPVVFASMKISWFFTCVPVPNDSDPLGYMMFAKQIMDAQQFFGAQSLNVKKLKHKFAAKTGEDFDTWFVGEAELAQAQQQQQQAAGAQNQSGTGTLGAGASALPGANNGMPQPTPARAISGKLPVNNMASVMR